MVQNLWYYLFSKQTRASLRGLAASSRLYATCYVQYVTHVIQICFNVTSARNLLQKQVVAFFFHYYKVEEVC